MRRRSELWVAGSVRPRRCGWCPAACRSALRAQHLRNEQLPIAGVGCGGLPRRRDPALSPLSGAWPPPLVAGVAVADHRGHLWQPGRSWWQPALALPPYALCVSDLVAIAADRRSVFRLGPSSHLRASGSGLTNRCSCRAARRATGSVSPVECLCFRAGRHRRPAAELNRYPATACQGCFSGF